MCQKWPGLDAIPIVVLSSVNIESMFSQSIFCHFSVSPTFCKQQFPFVKKYKTQTIIVQKSCFRKKNAIRKMSIDEIDTKLLLSRLSSKPGEISRTNGIDREGEVGPLFYCVHQSRQQVKSLTEQFFFQRSFAKFKFSKSFL